MSNLSTSWLTMRTDIRAEPHHWECYRNVSHIVVFKVDDPSKAVVLCDHNYNKEFDKVRDRWYLLPKLESNICCSECVKGLGLPWVKSLLRDGWYHIPRNHPMIAIDYTIHYDALYKYDNNSTKRPNLDWYDEHNRHDEPKIGDRMWY